MRKAVTSLSILILTGALIGQHAMAERQPNQADQSETTVVMLGTGTPVLNQERAGQSILIVVDKEMYLFDAGPGFVKNFDALSGKDFMPEDIYFSNDSVYGAMNKVFLTHLDSDHVMGMPELMLRPWIMGRSEPIKVVGPKGTEEMTTHVLEAYQADIGHRLHGTQPANSEGFKVEVTEISGTQVVHQDDRVTITAFKVPHGSWADGMAFGYRVEAPDKTVVISGDTRHDQALYEYFEGADILIHEVMSEQGVSRLSQDWQDYMYHAHTSAQQLAKIGRHVEPELLVLNHPLLFGQSDQQLSTEMASYYEGEFVLANDLDIYE
ncbi:MBL fold metallo-hydrolase [Modicisalibacter xianhensis]|uniref:Ribonuclease BN, tRNA processing enzyme n=1 Tax=Modicisalibacter xianhensis TaxID=442341 RepID=A0A1I3FYN1_9GAMM|nr:MBL fold metallo-hydrolase [Halomonas xianhensis]SFI16294.1 Ribonuclease BN, tRNA processing enzyme [Halomonas xianhensis]